MSSAPLRQWLPHFIVVSIAWGSSFLFIALALEKFEPAHIGWARVMIGAAVLAAVLAITRKRPQLTFRNVAAIGLVAVCLSGAPMVLIPIAQERITSILASMLNATTPLWTALFVALLIPAERVTRVQLGGLMVGAAGIAVLVGAWDVTSFPVLGVGLMLLATALYGVGSTLSRILLTKVKESGTTLTAVQMGLSALILAPFALASPPPAPDAFSPSQPALWGLLLLGVLGTSFAYVLFWKVVKVAGATTAAAVTYAQPVVATALGVLILSEPLHWNEPVGALMVLAGVALAQRKPSYSAPLPAREVKEVAEP